MPEEDKTGDARVMEEISDDLNCGERLRVEFQWKNFGLTHPSPHLFASSQWGCPRLYLGWRVFWALYHLGWLLYDWADDALGTKPVGSWLIYLTNWNYLMLTLDTLVLAIVQVYVTCARQELREGQGTWYLKVTWVIYTVASEITLLVTVLYFTLIFDGYLSFLSIAKHVLGSVYVLMDLPVTAIPVRLLHVVYPVIFCLVYLLFSIVYWAAGGLNPKGKVYIYKPLDWRQPGKAVLLSLGVAVAVVPLQHGVLWGLYMLRMRVWGWVRSRRGGASKNVRKRSCGGGGNEDARV